MSVLDKLASAQNREDEAPNIALAQEIAAASDTDAVSELADALCAKEKSIRHDVIKVLYEIGYIKPELIAEHVTAFIDLLKGRDNRMIWGAMTALGTIATQKAPDIWRQIDTIFDATTRGSVITQDWGIRVLAGVSSASSEYATRIFPYLLDFLKSCRPKDLPRHTESVLLTVDADNREPLLDILEKRLPSLRPAQAKRVEKAIKQIRTMR